MPSPSSADCRIVTLPLRLSFRVSAMAAAAPWLLSISAFRLSNSSPVPLSSALIAAISVNLNILLITPVLSSDDISAVRLFRSIRISLRSRIFPELS